MDGQIRRDGWLKEIGTANLKDGFNQFNIPKKSELTGFLVKNSGHFSSSVETNV